MYLRLGHLPSLVLYSSITFSPPIRPNADSVRPCFRAESRMEARKYVSAHSWTTECYNWFVSDSSEKTLVQQKACKYSSLRSSRVLINTNTKIMIVCLVTREKEEINKALIGRSVDQLLLLMWEIDQRKPSLLPPLLSASIDQGLTVDPHHPMLALHHD